MKLTYHLSVISVMKEEAWILCDRFRTEHDKEKRKELTAQWNSLNDRIEVLERMQK